MFFFKISFIGKNTLIIEFIILYNSTLKLNHKDPSISFSVFYFQILCEIRLENLVNY